MLNRATMEKDGLVSQKDMVGFVNNEFTRRQRDRQLYELQWQLNINFIEGNQYAEINPYTMAIEEVGRLYKWQEREVFNQIAPVVETRTARLSRMRPILKSRPATNSPKDVRSAKVSTLLLRNLYYEEGIQDVIFEIYGWMEATGTAFTKSVWNPDKGDVICHGITEDGDVQEIREGGLEVIVVPPHEIFPDSTYRQDMKDCKSIIHAKAVDVDEIYESWGVKVNPEQSNVVKLQKSAIGTGGFGGGFGYHFTSGPLKNHAIVKEYWERPSKKYPSGRLIIVANDKLLFEGEPPFPTEKDCAPGIPIKKVCSIKRPGVFWGRCVVDRLIPVQRRYNALRNRKAEFLNRVAIGQYLVEDGSTDLDELEVNIGQPGYMFVYQRGFNPPQQVRNQQLPVAFETEEQALLQEINVFSGTSDMAKQSKAPPGVKSGVAMSIALEQDDTRLANTAQNIESFLVQNAKVWLRYHQVFVSGSRTLRTVGEENIAEVVDWSGSDITSDDVIVEPFSAMAESPAQRRQMVFDLLASGLFHDEQGILHANMKSKIFEMIDMGNWESSDDDIQLHIAKAERQNMAMDQGEPQPVLMYDDHIIHVQRHNRHRLTVDFEQLTAEQPMIGQIYDQHVMEHLMNFAPPAPQEGQQGMTQIETP